jgi:hypothetical protein
LQRIQGPLLAATLNAAHGWALIAAVRLEFLALVDERREEEQISDLGVKP